MPFDAVKADATEAQIASDLMGPRRVLVVTPNATQERSIRETLQNMGLGVAVGYDATEAVVLVRQESPHVIVLDTAPGWPDPIVLRRVLRSNREAAAVPLVVLASRVQFRELFGSTPGSGEWTVSKPVIPGLLAEAVQAALAVTPVGDGASVEASLPNSGTPPAPEAAREPVEVQASRLAERTPDDEVVYGRAEAAVQAVLDDPDSDDKGLMQAVHGAAAALVDALRQRDGILFHAMNRNQPFGLASHSVNVAALSVKIGQGLKLSVDDLRKLAFVGLIHDLGMARVPQDLLNKEGTLNPAETLLIKTHPEHTQSVIESFGQEFKWAADIAYQEHERENGTGYPQGLEGGDIHQFAKVIAVADIFEAFSHPRTFRKTFVSNEALQKVIEMRGKFCSPPIIKALMTQLTMFPLGSYVQLNTGEIGSVVGISQRNMLSPSVSILYDSKGVRLEQERVTNLDEQPMLFVLKPLSDEDLPDARRAKRGGLEPDNPPAGQ